MPRKCIETGDKIQTFQKDCLIFSSAIILQHRKHRNGRVNKIGESMKYSIFAPLQG